MIQIKQVPGHKSWEIVKCPPEIYDELDRRGFIPQMGFVSRPGNTWIAPGKEAEVIQYLQTMGIEVETDYGGE
jgi:hypothetical protein